MDISSPYRMENIKALNKKFSFSDNKIVLTDTFSLARKSEITEGFLALIEPKIKDGALLIDDVALICNIEPKITAKELNITQVTAHIRYINRLHLEAKEAEFKITFECK